MVIGTNGKPIGWIDTHATFSGRTYRDQLLAAPPAAEPVKVKPLEWGRDYVDRMWYGNAPARQTGPSYLVGDNGIWCINGTGRWVHDQAGDVEAAKAACQADYEARIRSALVSEKKAE